MAVIDQMITNNYALYHGDCMEVLPSIPNDKVHLSIYSPPFTGLYQYSSSERDLSNCDSYKDFFDHYGYVIRELYRMTLPGRMTAVHCSDLISGNTGNDHIIDFTGDIIRAHEKEGWLYIARYCVWKEPLHVRNVTMAKSLMHRTIVEDSSRCDNAMADYLLIFKKRGKNPEPITHPNGLMDYAGSRQMPADIRKFRGYEGNQIENVYSHWIWRQYASAFWDDVRRDRVLPFKQAREEEDEKHVHPLQLDIIERIVTLWSNSNDIVLTPFMGVGSEVYGSVSLGRRGIGVELKPSYYAQAVKNLETVGNQNEQQSLFDMGGF